ncbi:unnamed protein product [Heligmosomoides polygyrus]|uniref:Rho-GAP domain-containing protein n=1 Tax=Heligmosomoides polygyrus TaxID=6339 RepID=A0A183F7K1_HELPZ|nr:unnamed protein product [Heligmosomoides polygyrus]
MHYAYYTIQNNPSLVAPDQRSELFYVFGPSLFNVNGDDNGYENCSEQIGAIIDLINGYDVIFEVTSREEICRAMVEQAQMHKASNSTIARADGLLVPIHVWERENRPFNVKIDLAAEEVCRKAVARRGFDAAQDGNYAIFEVVLGGALSRRLLPFEKLSVSVIDHWLTWQCTDGYLLFDHDNWPYNDAETILLLRERVDKVDWCPKCKKKDQKGPFLISLEGCALYLECCDDMCTPKWFTAIQNSLSMTVLEDFRLTSDNIPILVDKCLRFVAAYGIRSEGIYRRSGKILEAKEIYKGLTEDPVRTHIASSSEETVYAVADVLRQFFRRLKSPLFPHLLFTKKFSILVGILRLQAVFELAGVMVSFLSVGARASVDNAIRYQEYRRILQKLPLVHYHTLRKLVAFSDVTYAIPLLLSILTDHIVCFIL